MDLVVVNENDSELLIENDRLSLPSPTRRRCCCCFYGIYDFFYKIIDILGIKFVLFLFFSQFVGKGMLMQLLSGVMLPLFKVQFQSNASSTELYTMIIMLPWSLKPIIGLCSDFILIKGYNKRGWLVFGSLIGICALATLLLTSVLEITIVTLLLFGFMGANLQISLYDLLSEAKYSEFRQEHAELGSDVTTLVTGMNAFGPIVVLSFLGILSDLNLFWILFLIALILGILPVFPTLLGWMPEHKYVNARFFQFVEKEKFARELPKILVVAFCGLSSVLASALTMFVSPAIGLIVSFCLLVCCLAGCWRYFQSEITAVALYQVITTLSAPSIGSALDYFFTASELCLPNGPNFSYSYYISFAGIVGQILSLVAVTVYGKFLSKLRFRKVLLITTILQGFGGLSDLFIVLRWNVRLGIPDKYSYIIGEAVLEPVVDMLNYIPSSALISIFVTKDMEASCFAFLAGISNFSRMTTKLSGTIIFSLAGIDTAVGKVCNFDSLWWLVLICHIAMPVVIGIPAVFLIPDIEQDTKARAGE